MNFNIVITGPLETVPDDMKWKNITFLCLNCVKSVAGSLGCFVLFLFLVGSFGHRKKHDD